MFDGIESHYQAMREAGERLTREGIDKDRIIIAPGGMQQCHCILEHESAYLTGMDRICEWRLLAGQFLEAGWPSPRSLDRGQSGWSLTNLEGW